MVPSFPRKLSLLMFLVLAVSPLVEGNMSTMVSYLGTADGMRFYAEEYFDGNWELANKVCRDNFMRLATMRTAAQVELLQNSYNNQTFSGAFWTSGRDSQDITQFTWDDTESKPDGSFVFLNNIPVLNTCIAFNATPSNSGFVAMPCTEIAHVICEIVVLP